MDQSSQPVLKRGRSAEAAGALTPRLFWLSFGVTILLSLIPVWGFDYFPSQDGPVHLNSVAVLRDYREVPTYQHVYEPAWMFTTNQAFFWLYVNLGKFVPLLLAEKLLISLYLVAAPLALLLVLRWARSSPWAALPLVPALSSLALYMGFYSFCLSVPLFTLCLGAYQRFNRQPGWKVGLLLALLVYLTYLVHILAALWAIGLTGLYSLLDTWRSRGLKPLSALLGLVPTLVILFAFWLERSTRLASFSEEASAASALELPLTFVARLFGTPLGPLEKLRYLLGSLPYTPAWLVGLYFALLLALSALAWRSARRAGRLPSALSGGLVMLLGLLLTPERIDEFGWMPGRLFPLVVVALCLGIGSARLPKRVWQMGGLLTLGITLLTLPYRLPAHAEANAELSAYRVLGKALPPNSVVLPVHLDALFTTEERAAANKRPTFSPLYHAAGYLLLDKPLVNLRNYSRYHLVTDKLSRKMNVTDVSFRMMTVVPNN